MAGSGSYRLNYLWRVRVMRAGTPWSRVVEDPVYELETSAGVFELKVVALSSKTRKKAKKTYTLRRSIAGRTTAAGEGWYGVIINLENGKVSARGVIPEWLKAYLRA